MCETDSADFINEFGDYFLFYYESFTIWVIFIFSPDEESLALSRDGESFSLSRDEESFIFSHDEESLIFSRDSESLSGVEVQVKSFELRPEI